MENGRRLVLREHSQKLPVDHFALTQTFKYSILMFVLMQNGRRLDLREHSQKSPVDHFPLTQTFKYSI